MNILRRILGKQEREMVDNATNRQRTDDLYAQTEEGYIIAQDIACQHEYAASQTCPRCGGRLTIAAQINRASQGLNELVCTCQKCHQRASFIFDISNEAYQSWMAEQFGNLYIRNYDGPPRVPRQR